MGSAKVHQSKRPLAPEVYHSNVQRKRLTLEVKDSIEALPVKTEDGRLLYRRQKNESLEVLEQDEPQSQNERVPANGYKSVPEEPIIVTKESIAELATAVLSSPETNISNLKHLQDSCESGSDLEVATLAVLSLSAVYADILPGYKIRNLGESETSGQISKEVQKLREYEARLLKCYQRFVDFLVTRARVRKFRTVCIRGITTLLAAVPHFNFTQQLIAAVVPRMDSDSPDVRRECCGAIESLFAQEAKHDGEATTVAVELIADFVRQRQCLVRPQAVQVFEKLCFDEGLGRSSASGGSSQPKPRGSGPGSDPALASAASQPLLSKRQKKAMKRKLASKLKRDVEADFRASEAKADLEERRRRQTAALSAVFETYFRVLKTSLAVQLAANEDIPEPHPLLLTALSGLSKFSHLISVDFMADLLRVLEALAGPEPGAEPGAEQEEGAAGSLSVAERLACVCCALTVLRVNLDALTVDLQGFQGRFLALLPLLPLAEARLLCERLPETGLGRMWARCLHLLLWEGRHLDLQRCAGLIQRISQMPALHCQPGAAMAGLTVVGRLLLRHARCRTMLQNDDREAPGGAMGYRQNQSEDSVGQEALSSVLWELALLRRHFHPHVAQLAGQLARLAEDPTKVSGLLPPEETWEKYNPDSGAFFPSVPPPKKQKLGFSGRKAGGKNVGGIGEDTSGGDGVDPGEEVGIDVGFRQLFTELGLRAENGRLRKLCEKLRTVTAVMQRFREQGGKKAQGKKRKAKL